MDGPSNAKKLKLNSTNMPQEAPDIKLEPEVFIKVEPGDILEPVVKIEPDVIIKEEEGDLLNPSCFYGSMHDLIQECLASTPSATKSLSEIHHWLQTKDGALFAGHDNASWKVAVFDELNTNPCFVQCASRRFTVRPDTACQDCQYLQRRAAIQTNQNRRGRIRKGKDPSSWKRAEAAPTNNYHELVRDALLKSGSRGMTPHEIANFVQVNNMTDNFSLATLNMYLPLISCFAKVDKCLWTFSNQVCSGCSPAMSETRQVDGDVDTSRLSSDEVDPLSSFHDTSSPQTSCSQETSSSLQSSSSHQTSPGSGPVPLYAHDAIVSALLSTKSRSMGTGQIFAWIEKAQVYLDWPPAWKEDISRTLQVASCFVSSGGGSNSKWMFSQASLCQSCYQSILSNPLKLQAAKSVTLLHRDVFTWYHDLVQRALAESPDRKLTFPELQNWLRKNHWSVNGEAVNPAEVKKFRDSYLPKLSCFAEKGDFWVLHMHACRQCVAAIRDSYLVTPDPKLLSTHLSGPSGLLPLPPHLQSPQQSTAKAAVSKSDSKEPGRRHEIPNHLIVKNGQDKQLIRPQKLLSAKNPSYHEHICEALKRARNHQMTKDNILNWFMSIPFFAAKGVKIKSTLESYLSLIKCFRQEPSSFGETWTFSDTTCDMCSAR